MTDLDDLKQSEPVDQLDWMQDWFHRNVDPLPPKRSGLTVTFDPGCILALMALVAFAACIAAALLR